MSVVEATWAKILSEPVGRAGTVGRRLSPAGAVEIWAGLERPSETPLIFVRAATSLFRSVRELPRAAGIDVRLEREAGGTHSNLLLKLREQRFRTLFGVLSEDVVQHALLSAEHEPAIGAFVGRLRRWQSFIGRHGVEGLTAEEQQGLYAELWVLRHMAVPRAGAESAVNAWTGPTGTAHDFQFQNGAVEVKSTAPTRPYLVRIASPVQLDDAGLPALFLLHVALEKRATGGESLPKIVASTRTLFGGNEYATDFFEERLVDAGYLDVHEQLYRGREYRVLEHQFFHVRDDFPRLRVHQIPAGIQDVSYTVDLDGCGKWLLPDGEALSVFETPHE